MDRIPVTAFQDPVHRSETSVRSADGRVSAPIRQAPPSVERLSVIAVEIVREAEKAASGRTAERGSGARLPRLLLAVKNWIVPADGTITETSLDRSSVAEAQAQGIDLTVRLLARTDMTRHVLIQVRDTKSGADWSDTFELAQEFPVGPVDLDRLAWRLIDRPGTYRQALAAPRHPGDRIADEYLVQHHVRSVIEEAHVDLQRWMRIQDWTRVHNGGEMFRGHEVVLVPVERGMSREQSGSLSFTGKKITVRANPFGLMENNILVTIARLIAEGADEPDFEVVRKRLMDDYYSGYRDHYLKATKLQYEAMNAAFFGNQYAYPHLDIGINVVVSRWSDSLTQVRLVERTHWPQRTYVFMIGTEPSDAAGDVLGAFLHWVLDRRSAAVPDRLRDQFEPIDGIARAHVPALEGARMAQRSDGAEGTGSGVITAHGWKDWDGWRDKHLGQPMPSNHRGILDRIVGPTVSQTSWRNLIGRDPAAFWREVDRLDARARSYIREGFAGERDALSDKARAQIIEYYRREALFASASGGIRLPRPDPVRRVDAPFQAVFLSMALTAARILGPMSMTGHWPLIILKVLELGGLEWMDDGVFMDHHFALNARYAHLLDTPILLAIAAHELGHNLISGLISEDDAVENPGLLALHEFFSEIFSIAYLGSEFPAELEGYFEMAFGQEDRETSPREGPHEAARRVIRSIHADLRPNAAAGWKDVIVRLAKQLESLEGAGRLDPAVFDLSELAAGWGRSTASSAARMSDTEKRAAARDYVRGHRDVFLTPIHFFETPAAFYIFHGALHAVNTPEEGHPGLVDAYAVENVDTFFYKTPEWERPADFFEHDVQYQGIARASSAAGASRWTPRPTAARARSCRSAPTRKSCRSTCWRHLC